MHVTDRFELGGVINTAAAQRDFVKRMTRLLESEGVAYDIAGYGDAPPGLRVWCGTTVETADVRGADAWFDWAFARTSA